jgi:hypothetical protein
MKTFAARYRDHLGEEPTTIVNDGKLLTMELRGVQFQGARIDDFEPADSTDPAKLASFELSHNCLCNCIIEAELPVPVFVKGNVLDGIISFILELGNPLQSGLLDREHLTVRLNVDGLSLVSSGKSGWFEDELLDVQAQLQAGMHMMACINCAYSDYSPLGHGLFGDLACFRDNKVNYLKVASKRDIFAIWGTLTEYVQQTHLCPEFERRKPGTGYRG